MAKSGGGSVGMARTKGRIRENIDNSYKFDILNKKEIENKIKDLFGSKKITNNDIAALAGAFKGSTVSLYISGDKLGVGIKNNQVSFQTRYIGKDKKGLYIQNERIRKSDNASPGLGAKMLSLQVKAASKLGVNRLVTKATGKNSSNFNGYYTWARLGYNGKLSKEVRSKLPANLSTAKTIHALFGLKGGSSWWKENGSTTDMTFNTRKGSTSRKILAKYIREKRKIK